MSGKNKNLHNKVRIIGGAWRRRQLSFPDQDGLRPTPDRVRETLFNWLGQELTGLNVLDLFAGSGALGLEAASRGARRVVMVEKSRLVAEALRANCRLLGGGMIEVINQDALVWLVQSRDVFDVILLDPPFASDLLARVLPLLASKLAPQGVVYAECPAWPDLDGWQVLREGKAGAVRYGLLQRAQGLEEG